MLSVTVSLRTFSLKLIVGTCEVRWLSRSYVLKRFFYLRSEIDIFMTEKNRVVTELADLSLLWKLAFLVDITQLLSELNLKLQEANSLISNTNSRN